MIELTPQLVRKHIDRLVEADAQVKAYTRRSKTGKQVQVHSHSRHINVEHMGEKFKLRGDVHPEAHIQMLRSIAVRGFNTADRIKKRGLTNEKYSGSLKNVSTYGDMGSAAAKRSLAATDLIQYIHHTNPDLVTQRAGVPKHKHTPTKGHKELKAHYDTMRNRRGY